MIKSTQKDLVKCLQINLNHCANAMTLLSSFMEEQNLDIALLQDPYYNSNGELASLPISWARFHSYRGSAAIVVRSRELVYSHLFTGQNSIFITFSSSEGEVCIGSIYIAPSQDFEESMDEWAHLISRSRYFILGGDFDANSPLWNCPTENERGPALIEFCVINNLLIANDHNSKPTFKKNRGNGNSSKGWPDLTLTNTKTFNILTNWKVDKTPNASDHRYILFDLDSQPQLISKRRFYTKLGNYTKFKNLLKQNMSTLSTNISNINDTTELNIFTNRLQSSIIAAATKAFRLKKTHRKPKLSFWNDKLKIERNRLNAIRKKLNTFKKLYGLTDGYEQLRINYNRDYANFKKQIKAQKRMAWIKFCNETSSKSGAAQKFYSGKYFSPDEIQLQLPPEKASKKESLALLTETLFGTTHEQINYNDFHYNPKTDKPFTPTEIKSTLYKFNVNKAPGPDQIDFRILRASYEALPDVFHQWCNKCLLHSYFPKCLRVGEVVYFLKQGKDKNDPNSYRPICLLPTLGKLLEKLIVNRLVYHLENNNILHNNQFGFREGRSCDLALSKIINKINSNISEGKYTSLVSLDIKGAFDNISWSYILRALEKISCPGNIAGAIASYLSEREVEINWGAGSKRFGVYKGCPQGSCLGPILWLLVANKMLNSISDAGYDIYAFADDFSFVFSGKTRRLLEEEGNSALSLFSQLLTEVNLTLSRNKSKALTFSKPYDLRKRPPIFYLYGQSISNVKSIKLLGITIDKFFNWITHINDLKLKLQNINNNSKKLFSRNWGVKKSLQKFWYLTIAEKIITYGAGVWAGSLTGAAIDKLLSIQRMFLLPLASGYSSISTDALMTITGIPPIHLTLQYEHRRTRILQLQDTNYTDRYFPNSLIQSKVNSWLLHPAEDISPNLVNINKNSYKNHTGTKIFTDGSKSDPGVGSAFCVMEDSGFTHEWACRLDNTNSIYQAELYAILAALEWGETQRKPITIYSDSLSSLQAIHEHRTRHPLVLLIKQKLISSSPLIRLAHVSAHVGIPGNERADVLAKQAAQNIDTEIKLPIPPSKVKCTLKKEILQQWQHYWNGSIKGRHTYNLIPKVSLRIQNLNPYTTAFLTGHGPFKAYLHGRHRADSPDCECGDFGSSTHYYHSCILTSTNHILKPPGYSGKWLEDVLTRPFLLRKLREIYDFCSYLSNLT